ncbi:MAG: hypothetical protein Q8L15_18560, partial [Methylobacter sp.]|nr:hypothetical protein [Methylobacter sp.]
MNEYFNRAPVERHVRAGEDDMTNTETMQHIYGLLRFASFFSLIATVSQRSCCHISGLLMRSLLPLALMDFRVFSS